MFSDLPPDLTVPSPFMPPNSTYALEELASKTAPLPIFISPDAFIIGAEALPPPFQPNPKLMEPLQALKLPISMLSAEITAFAKNFITE